MEIPNFTSAYEKIKDLVATFRQNEHHYLSQSYSEAAVRQDFLDDFFTALGWDVRHKEQKNPFEQEVKIEKGVKISGAQKRADYSFSIAPKTNDPKFFVEAKKPAKALRNAQDYFQSIRYGWHKAHPFAILTDFEEFHILDCRYTPDINNSLDKCYKYYHYTDYLDQEKFAEIYWLFSREAVANNSIEKVAETLPKRKGKAAAIYEAHQTIDEAFLEVIDNIREKLAKAFKKNDENLTSEELTEATQRTVDRLVFIRFLEDKLIEQEHWVSEFGSKSPEAGKGKSPFEGGMVKSPFEGGKGDVSAWKDFISACRKLNAKYNGIVFKEHFIDHQNFAGPEATEFRNICQNICHLNSRFLFNEIPIHILGSIYERFLGKVVDATAKRVTVKEKPEVQKAGGVYYTPKYIVDYIVQNTIAKLIENKTPEQIAKLRFADIACGSGSFLIGVFECLLDYHNKYYQQHPDKAKKDKCIEKDGQWVLSIQQKQKILLNNIYGVDIDQQATEVTQLSLALKMMEDETTATANDMMVLFHEKILPDMSKNIICGNSLIGTDILTHNLFSPFGGDKEGVSTEAEQKLNPMNFHDVFKDIMNNGGFDAIVGNPPYVMLQNFESRESFKYALNKFKSAKYKIDTYQLFIESSINLLKKNGLLGYITPNTFLKNIHSEPLRDLILSNTSIIEFLLFGYNVFKSASVDVCVFILEKGISKGKNAVIINEAKQEFKPEIKNKIIQDLFNSNTKKDFDVSIDPQDNILLEKLTNNSFSLGSFCDAYFGIQTFDRKKYVSEKQLNEKFKPVIDGANINTYSLSSPSEYVFYIPEAIKSGGNEKVYMQDRICIRQIGSFPIATFVKGGIFTLNTIYNVYLKDSVKDQNLFFLLSIINSSVTRYFWKKKNSDEKQLFPKIKKAAILSIPIPKIDFQNKTEKAAHDKIVSLVAQMLQAKKDLKTAKTDKDKTYFERKCTSLDNAIDTEVYKLYDLTDEEISIVENSKS